MEQATLREAQSSDNFNNTKNVANTFRKANPNFLYILMKIIFISSKHK